MAAAPTRGRARTELAARLRQAGLAGADLDARVLLCAACGITHVGLVAQPDEQLGTEAGAKLEAYALRRLAGEPVSRILGRREFWGLEFAVTPDVLDPRPETEGLVAAALEAVGGRRSGPLRLLDLGTGSGAILAALLTEMPGAFGVGVDRSPGACRVADANVLALGLRERAGLICGSWTAPLAGRFDLVVSNPPYIPGADIAGLEREVRDHDPTDALDGGLDGFAAYRAILAALPEHLAAGGVAAFECGHDQGDDLAGLMRDAGLKSIAVDRDLAGHQRVVLGHA